MRKTVLFVIGFIICICFLMASSGLAATKKAAAPQKTNKSDSSVPIPEAKSKFVPPPTDAPPPANAVRGGVARWIRPTFPKNLGYPPEWAPADSIFALPVMERLMDWDAKGNLIPWLAERWESDPQKATITFYLRKGVKFHDGTPFNAAAAKWNYQLALDTKSQIDGDFIKSMDIVDEYTLRFNCSEINSWLAYIYGFRQFISPTSFEKNGGLKGGGIEWARANGVGTGPFKVVEFKRDAYMKYEKNPNYWRKGYPLLDGYEDRMVPDPVTASMLMESKEADFWGDVGNTKQILDLEKKGLKVNWGPGMFWALLPANAKDPKTPLANKKVREAIEYALDRPTIAKSIGFGKYEPMNQLVPSASEVYNKGYDPRPYNPEKAKQLLAEAGYPNGLDLRLTSIDTQRDTATAIQTYLGAVGIRISIDVADMGRYFAAVFSPTGWTDLIIAQSGINPDSTDIFVHFGPRPWTYRWGFIAKSPEFLAACEKAFKTYDPVGFKASMQAAVKVAAEDAMVIPLWRSVQGGVIQPWMHTDFPRIHSIVHWSHQDWIEKRK
jgi:peptide/nickel transport system substrate-binding protein